MSAYEILIEKLSLFVKKYYKNFIIRGSLIFLTVSIFLFLTIIFSESLAYFSVTFRTFLFYFFVLTNISVFIFFILIPILKLLNISKTISYEQASNIISNFFPQIQDKLINAIELYKMNNKLTQPDKLILAGIEQKINSVSVFRFTNAVNYKENYKYLRFLVPLLILFFAFAVFKPSVMFNSTKRVMNHSVYYEKPSPIKFLLLNDTLNVMKGSSFDIKLQISGEFVPSEVYISFEGNEFLMKNDKNEKTVFIYSVKNLNKSLKFHFNADQYSSSEFSLKVLPSPLILNFSLSADYPEYTGLQDKTYENIGDLNVPEGTKLHWKFSATDTDSIFFISEKRTLKLLYSDNFFVYYFRIFNDFKYSLSLNNSYFKKNNVVNYTISAKKDFFPSVYVNSVADSVNFFLNYFKGNIEDDYGFSALYFNYKLISDISDNNKSTFNRIKININTNITNQEFFHFTDFSQYLKTDVNSVQYYFEVFDNDAVNGNKSTKSEMFTFKLPDANEINDFMNNAEKNLQFKIDYTKNLASQIQSDLNNLKQKNLNSDLSDWENTQLLRDIYQKQSQLEQLLDELSLENIQKNNLENTFSEQNEDLLKKQKEIEQLMDELFTDEMKKMMEKINELQNSFDKKLFDELMKNNQTDFDKLSEKLDRNKELLKRYEVEQNISETVDELNDLAKKQSDLADQTLNKHSDREKLKNQQKNIENQLQELKKNYNQTLQKNSELAKPFHIDNFEQDFNQIQQEFNKTNQSLEQNQKNKAFDSQKSNSKNMQNLAQKMQSAADASMQAQNGEDILAMKKLLNALLTFSFEQENLINIYKNVSAADNSYLSYLKKQMNLKDNFQNINDSLSALASRQTSVSAVVSKELDIINSNLANSLLLMEQRNIKVAVQRQMAVMTSANNLAVLFTNIIKSMEQNQASGSGKGKANQNPKESLEQMQSQQESLKKQMEKMLKQLQEQGNQDPKMLNKQFAQMLAKQEIFRQMMQDLKAKFNLSPETQKLLNEIEKLAKQNEKDFVNKRITPEMLNRQKLIQTRLLEAQNAENKKETENKRKSDEAKDTKYKSPQDFFEKYKDKRSFDENLYNNYNFKFKTFYKNLNNNYYDKINK